MSINKYFIFILFLFGSFSSFAGDRKGNGADFISCKDRAYLLDFYEGNLSEISWQGSDVELVKFLLNKILPFSPTRIKSYQEFANNFYDETKFVGESELGNVPDAGDVKVPIPDDCKFVQGVIQKHIIFGTEKRYLINKDEWTRLSVVHRAGVIIHELVYRELQSVDSHQIRQFTNWLFSTGVDPIPGSVFYKNLQSTGFEWVYLYGFPMDVQKLIWNDGPIRSTYTFPGMPFVLSNQIILSKRQIVDSFSNGRPKLIQFDGRVKFENGQYTFDVCAPGNNIGCKMNLNENGKIIFLNHVDLVEKSSGKHVLNKVIKFNDKGEVDEII